MGHDFLILIYFTPNMHAGKFLKMFLGPVNVRVARKEDKLKIKDEYNNYRVCLRYFLYVIQKEMQVFSVLNIKSWINNIVCFGFLTFSSAITDNSWIVMIAFVGAKFDFSMHYGRNSYNMRHL